MISIKEKDEEKTDKTQHHEAKYLYLSVAFACGTGFFFAIEALFIRIALRKLGLKAV